MDGITKVPIVYYYRDFLLYHKKGPPEGEPFHITFAINLLISLVVIRLQILFVNEHRIDDVL